MGNLDDRIRNWLYIAITVLTIIAFGGAGYGTLKGDVDQNTEHRLDKDVHMPFEDRVKMFPTREEFNQILHQTDRILNKLDDIEKELRK